MAIPASLWRGAVATGRPIETPIRRTLARAGLLGTEPATQKSAAGKCVAEWPSLSPKPPICQPVPGNDRADIEALESVERDRLDGREGERERRRIRGGDVLGHGFPNRGLQADAAALAAHVDEQAWRGLVQMRQMILRHGEASAQGERERHVRERR